MRIGVFGGTFSPPHIGHLIVAEEMREKLKLDKVLFIPAFSPPHKRRFVAYEHRREMVKIAIADNPHFSLSEIERERGGPSFTVDTLKELKRIYPKDKLFLIIGADQFSELTTWKNPEEIFQQAKVCVMERPGVKFGRMRQKFPKALILSVSQIGIRGKEIRRRIRRGISVRYLLPDKVYQYILANKLYKERL